ncbi:hypothetical protein [Novosphingobium resinovorum]|uniref:hypothetical protein n=1 Tax=Novosphingobium resinovorum TaxID=158500 RepID=UPI0012EAB0F7|nr:hypothetical protein [Novosphingobium resinovorum]
MTLIESIRAATRDPATVERATSALELVRQYIGTVHRLPGCDTMARLCVRIYDGMTEEEAAAREYAYRWHLCLNQWVNFAQTDRPGSRNSSRCCTGAWPVPHAIGM